MDTNQAVEVDPTSATVSMTASEVHITAGGILLVVIRPPIGADPERLALFCRAIGSATLVVGEPVRRVA